MLSLFKMTIKIVKCFKFLQRLQLLFFFFEKLQSLDEKSFGIYVTAL